MASTLTATAVKNARASIARRELPDAACPGLHLAPSNPADQSPGRCATGVLMAVPRASCWVASTSLTRSQR